MDTNKDDSKQDLGPLPVPNETPAAEPAQNTEAAETAKQAAEVAPAPPATVPAPIVDPGVLVTPPVVPAPPLAEEFNCPDCDFKGEGRAQLWGHMMGKHGTPRAKEYWATLPKRRLHAKKPDVAQARPNPASNGSEPELVTPPDFSDVTGKPAQPEIVTAAVAATTIDYKAMSGAIFDMTTGIASNIFGDEWRPKNEQERDMVCNALGDYLRAKDIKDLPPGLVLSIVVIAYSAPRMRAQPTKDKLARGWLWLKSKFQRKKPVIKVMPAPQS